MYKTYLNIGCGNYYHKDWTNIDFVSKSKDVVAHNLLNGIPFPDYNFDVVYHSHVLEHFQQKDGEKLIQECFRVLKKGGIIRIAVPDLEVICKEYLKHLDKALKKEEQSQFDYEWIKLEMYDQTIRNKSGGAMVKYLFQDNIPNEDYVFKRIGIEGKLIREKYLKQSKVQIENNPRVSSLRKTLLKIKYGWRYFLLTKDEKKAMKIGQFRLGGEIHQWMYDRYSLSNLLTNCGFADVRIMTAFESQIEDWNSYNLDIENGLVRKPDSIFIEATKK
jgi:predicted SAM-dependent methyltransferase